MNNINNERLNQANGIAIAINALHTSLKQAIQRCQIKGDKNYDAIAKAEIEILNASLQIQRSIENEIAGINV